MRKEGPRSIFSDIEEDIGILKQLINSLDEAEQQLEEAYKKEDPERLNKIKKFMLEANSKIADMAK